MGAVQGSALVSSDKEAFRDARTDDLKSVDPTRDVISQEAPVKII